MSIHFVLTNRMSFHDKVVQEGKTDAEGNATETFAFRQCYKNMGLLQADFYTTVFDETGRPVSQPASAEILHPECIFWNCG